MSNSNAKGDRRERELVNRFDEAGYAVMRAPASGSATERELPDVLAGDGDRFYAVEAKSSAGDPIYLDGVEVEALTYFARNFGAAPRVGVRFDREDWYFFHPADCYTTDGGNYRVKKERALAEGTDFPELVGEHARRRLDGFDGDGAAGDAHADDPPADAPEAPPARDERTEPAPVEAAERALDDATMDVLAALERGDIDHEDAAAMIADRRS